MSVTTIDVVTRAVFVALLAAVAIWSIWRTKHASNHERALVRVTVRATPLYHSPSHKERVRAAGQLSSGAVVVGMLFALVVAVLVAYLFGAVIGLLD
jgi:diacylglycerol kinase